jgi:calcineurin-like phosphoesterase family protein
MMSVRARRISSLSALGAMLVLACCSKSPAPSSPTAATANGASATGARVGFLVGAGDIGFCGPSNVSGSEATARLLDRLGGTIFTAGDNAYPAGSAENYAQCYEPAWGRHLGRTRPSPGNHEYVSGGVPYFGYFGARAGVSATGYYSYSVGAWHVISLNSEIASSAASAQMDWLRGELASNPSACTAVYWHRPLFSSGRHGDNPDMRDVWRTLYAANVDVVINGHDHTYERFAPQDPDGRLDPARGIREFVVGTGGSPLYEFSAAHANSEIRGSAWGVISFTLLENGYQWEFVPVEGQTFRDAGVASCH